VTIRIASAGHAAFAAVVFALGVAGLGEGDFSPVWRPVPNDVPAREALVYACAAVSLVAAVGLIWRSRAKLGTRALLGQLVIWLLAFRVPSIVRAPATFAAWDGCAETMVMVGGAWVLYAWFADGFAAGERGVRIARLLYGLAVIPFGVAHFLYLDETASLVPDWMPGHVAWACFTGAAFLAASAAILTGVLARLASALLAVQIGLFTVLVWIPIIATGNANAFQRSELGLSAALTAGAWVVADSYRIATRS
jgi:hypothetical protein